MSPSDKRATFWKGYVMRYRNRSGKINVSLLVILILVMVAVAMSLVAARQIRRSILVKVSLKAGQEAFDKQDWPAASSNFQEYLGRRPDDVDVLRKYALARLGMRPIDASNIAQAIAGYRRVMQLAPLDNVAYEKLAMLYTSMGNFEELSYVARARLQHDPNDLKAPLWLAEALIRLNRAPEAQEKLLPFLKQLEALPGKHVEYVRACMAMSQISLVDNSGEAKTQALEWMNKALQYFPNSAEALARRAHFYRQTPDIPGVSAGEAAGLVRRDLEAADAAATDEAEVRYLIGTEWLALGELDRVRAELQAVDALPKEKLAEHFLDINDWKAARFLLASDLAMRKKVAAEQLSLADEALANLTDKSHRAQILPSAVLLYVSAGHAAQARKCLDEYLELQHNQTTNVQSPAKLAYLQAMVARAEDNAYAVIDVLQPIVLTDSARPELWQLLAEAFSRTDQPRRAVAALVQYLRLHPQDPEMTLQLAKEYLKLQEWNQAFETVRLAEPLNPTDIVLKLLRIEANVHVVAEQGQQASATRLKELSEELAGLRKVHPDRVDIRILQAVIMTYLGQGDKAEQELKLAVAECKEPLRAEMQLVRNYYRDKRLADAIDVCKAACERHAELAEPWLSLASLYASRSDYDLARSCLKQGATTVTARWEKRSLSIELALLEVTHGDRAVGVALLRDIAAQDQREIYARTLLLSIREVQQDRAGAQKLVDELRQTEGASGLMWRLHQASLWLSSEDWRSKQQDAADLLQYCIDSDPEWSAPVLLLADMYSRLENFRRAEDIYRQALVRNRSATEIVDRLIALFEKQGRFSDAEQVLQQSGSDSQVASAWHIRSALREGEFSRAIDELKVRVSNNDRDADSRILLARLIYWQSKDVNEAFRYLRQAEAITADSTALVSAKASILHADGQTEAAQRVLDDYVTKRGDFRAYAMRAIYLASRGQIDRAEEDYKKLIAFAGEGAGGYILLSNFYVDTKRLDKGVTVLEEGLNAHPDDQVLTRGLMKLLFLRAQGQDQSRASDILAALEQQKPQDPELIRLRAVQLLRQGTRESLAAAKEKLELAVKLEPTAADAHLGLMGIAMQQGDYVGARDYAIRALGSNPNNLALLCARGRAELALGNTEMAVQVARLAMTRDPNNADARDVLVDAALQSNNRGLLEEARTLTESWTKRKPADERLLLAQARVLASLGTPEKAIPPLEAYSQTSQGGRSTDALVMLADLYRLTGDMDKSKQKIDQVAGIDPNDQRVVHTRFLWLLAQKRFADLEGISSAYISAKGQDPQMVLSAGSILVGSDSAALKKEGLKLLEHAVTLSPTSAQARLSLASGFYQAGDIERAEQMYRQLIEQDLTNVQALNDLAWILQERKHDYAAALEFVNKGLGLARDDTHLLDTRGTILAKMEGRLADAKYDFQRLVELSPNDSPQKAKALLQLGRICVKLTDLAQARQHLQKASEIDKKINVFTADERSEIARVIQP
jgi:Tfp pilus assembly protein PilF